MGNSIPEVPAHCFALLRTLGRVFEREKNIFGFRVFNYTYWALVRAPGLVWWDGLQRMRLDDAVPIGKVLPFWDVRITWARACCWAQFSMPKKVY